MNTLKRFAKGELPPEKVQIVAYLALGGRIVDGEMVDMEDL